MNDELSILFQFDPETLKLKAILLSGRTDDETAKLKEIADRMLTALEDEDQ